jgi:hypothetical protein
LVTATTAGHTSSHNSSSTTTDTTKPRDTGSKLKSQAQGHHTTSAPWHTTCRVQQRVILSSREEGLNPGVLHRQALSLSLGTALARDSSTSRGWKQGQIPSKAHRHYYKTAAGANQSVNWPQQQKDMGSNPLARGTHNTRTARQPHEKGFWVGLGDACVLQTHTYAYIARATQELCWVNHTPAHV